MDEMAIELESPAPAKRVMELHDRLVSSGQALDGSELTTFVLSVTDGQGDLTAGCKGEIAFRSAHISELWVDARHRGQGLGRALLAAAEDHAAKNGCIRVHLETRSEKARALYERVGYRLFGTLPDYDGDQAFHYLEKRLD